MPFLLKIGFDGIDYATQLEPTFQELMINDFELAYFHAYLKIINWGSLKREDDLLIYLKNLIFFTKGN